MRRRRRQGYAEAPDMLWMFNGMSTPSKLASTTWLTRAGRLLQQDLPEERVASTQTWMPCTNRQGAGPSVSARILRSGGAGDGTGLAQFVCSYPMQPFDNLVLDDRKHRTFSQQLQAMPEEQRGR
jgi:hypothetical protein